MAGIDSIVSGKLNRPRLIMLYGVEGIGKSTFGAMAPSPIFIPTEDGLGDIDCQKFPVAKDYGDFMDSVTNLYEMPNHDFKTLVIDSLDWLEKMIWGEVAKTYMVKAIGEIDFGKGYETALAYWNDILNAFKAFRDDKGMHVILIAHSKITRFNDPENTPYDRYTPKLHEKANAMIREWCDEVLFARYDVKTTSEDVGFNKKKVKGIGGERVIRTTEKPAHMGKNRLNLPRS